MPFDVQANHPETRPAKGRRKASLSARRIDDSKVSSSALESDCAIEDSLLDRTQFFQMTSPSLESRQDAALKMATHARSAPAAVAPAPENTAPRYSPQSSSFVKISKTD